MELYEFKPEENENKLRKSLLILYIYFIMPTVISLLFLKLPITISKENYNLVLGYLNFISPLVVLTLILLLSKKLKIQLFNRKSTFKLNIKNAFWINIMMWLLMMVPTFILTLAKNEINGSISSNNQEIIKEVTKSTPMIIMFLSVVIISPILEEIIFRGIPLFLSTKYSFLNTQLGMLLRVFTSSFIFGYLHNPKNIVELASYMASGIILGLIVLKTNSIKESTFAHIINNLLGFLIMI